eukprot:1251809-Amphidinium_carterae.1
MKRGQPSSSVWVPPPTKGRVSFTPDEEQWIIAEYDKKHHEVAAIGQTVPKAWFQDLWKLGVKTRKVSELHAPDSLRTVVRRLRGR